MPLVNCRSFPAALASKSQKDREQQGKKDASGEPPEAPRRGFPLPWHQPHSTGFTTGQTLHATQQVPVRRKGESSLGCVLGTE